MDNLTVKEDWIDKLIDDYVDTKNDLIESEISSNDLYKLKEIIFNNTALDYSGNGLRIASDTAIIEYLRVLYPDSYNISLERLKEAETRNCEVKEGAENG